MFIDYDETSEKHEAGRYFLPHSTFIKLLNEDLKFSSTKDFIQRHLKIQISDEDIFYNTDKYQKIMMRYLKNLLDKEGKEFNFQGYLICKFNDYPFASTDIYDLVHSITSQFNWFCEAEPITESKWYLRNYEKGKNEDWYFCNTTKFKLKFYEEIPGLWNKLKARKLFNIDEFIFDANEFVSIAGDYSGGLITFKDVQFEWRKVGAIFFTRIYKNESVYMYPSLNKKLSYK